MEALGADRAITRLFASAQPGFRRAALSENKKTLAIIREIFREDQHRLPIP
jgi:hypothetical protein